MSRALACAAVMLCAGCYDVDGLTSLYAGGDLGATTDGGIASFSPHQLLLWSGQIGGGGSVDGTGSEARFTSPSGVAIADDENVYVLDRGAQTISHVVLSTGVVTRIAGSPGRAGTVDGTGASARLNGPTSAIFLDGHVYFTEFDGNTVRRLDPATGNVTTIAGQYYGAVDGLGTAAKFAYPSGIATDGSALYVCDLGSHLIRRVDTSGNVTTLAGSTGGYMDGAGLSAQFSSPVGAAIDGSTLYILDENNRLLRTMDLMSSGHYVETLAGEPGIIASANDGPFTGAGLAHLGVMQGAAFIGSTLYLTDHYTQTIRAVSLTASAITTVAGLSVTGGAADGALTSARFSAPDGIAATSTGRLVVADEGGNHTVRLVDLAQDKVSTIAGLPEHAGSADGAPAQASFVFPLGIVATKDAVFVADAGGHLVRRVDLDGVVTTIAGIAGSQGVLDGDVKTALLDTPNAVAVGDDGTVYITDIAQHTVRALQAGMLRTLAGGAGLPPGLVDGQGTTARLNAPQALAVDDTTLYIADTGNNVLRRVKLADGVVTTLKLDLGGGVIGCAASPGVFSPAGLALDRTRRMLYVTARDNCVVLAVDLMTDQATVLAGGAAGAADGTGVAGQLDHPGALALDDAGILYVSDVGNATLRRIDLATRAMSTLAGKVDYAKVVLGSLPDDARLNRAGGLAYLPTRGLVATIPSEDALLLLK